MKHKECLSDHLHRLNKTHKDLVLKKQTVQGLLNRLDLHFHDVSHVIANSANNGRRSSENRGTHLENKVPSELWRQMTAEYEDYRHKLSTTADFIEEKVKLLPKIKTSFQLEYPLLVGDLTRGNTSSEEETEDSAQHSEVVRQKEIAGARLMTRLKTLTACVDHKISEDVDDVTLGQFFHRLQVIVNPDTASQDTPLLPLLDVSPQREQQAKEERARRALSMSKERLLNKAKQLKVNKMTSSHGTDTTDHNKGSTGKEISDVKHTDENDNHSKKHDVNNHRMTSAVDAGSTSKKDEIIQVPEITSSVQEGRSTSPKATSSKLTSSSKSDSFSGGLGDSSVGDSLTSSLLTLSTVSATLGDSSIQTSAISASDVKEKGHSMTQDGSGSEVSVKSAAAPSLLATHGKPSARGRSRYIQIGLPDKPCEEDEFSLRDPYSGHPYPLNTHYPYPYLTSDYPARRRPHWPRPTPYQPAPYPGYTGRSQSLHGYSQRDRDSVEVATHTQAVQYDTEHQYSGKGFQYTDHSTQYNERSTSPVTYTRRARSTHALGRVPLQQQQHGGGYAAYFADIHTGPDRFSGPPSSSTSSSSSSQYRAPVEGRSEWPTDNGVKFRYGSAELLEKLRQQAAVVGGKFQAPGTDVTGTLRPHDLAGKLRSQAEEMGDKLRERLKSGSTIRSAAASSSGVSSMASSGSSQGGPGSGETHEDRMQDFVHLGSADTSGQGEVDSVCVRLVQAGDVMQHRGPGLTDSEAELDTFKFPKEKTLDELTDFICHRQKVSSRGRLRLWLFDTDQEGLFLPRRLLKGQFVHTRLRDLNRGTVALYVQISQPRDRLFSLEHSNVRFMFVKAPGERGEFEVKGHHQVDVSKATRAVIQVLKKKFLPDCQSPVNLYVEGGGTKMYWIRHTPTSTLNTDTGGRSRNGDVLVLLEDFIGQNNSSVMTNDSLSGFFNHSILVESDLSLHDASHTHCQLHHTAHSDSARSSSPDTDQHTDYGYDVSSLGHADVSDDASYNRTSPTDVETAKDSCVGVDQYGDGEGSDVIVPVEVVRSDDDVMRQDSAVKSVVTVVTVPSVQQSVNQFIIPYDGTTSTSDESLPSPNSRHANTANTNTNTNTVRAARHATDSRPQYPRWDLTSHYLARFHANDEGVRGQDQDGEVKGQEVAVTCADRRLSVYKGGSVLNFKSVELCQKGLCGVSSVTTQCIRVGHDSKDTQRSPTDSNNNNNNNNSNTATHNLAHSKQNNNVPTHDYMASERDHQHHDGEIIWTTSYTQHNGPGNTEHNGMDNGSAKSENVSTAKSVVNCGQGSAERQGAVGEKSGKQDADKQDGGQTKVETRPDQGTPSTPDSASSDNSVFLSDEGDSVYFTPRPNFVFLDRARNVHNLSYIPTTNHYNNTSNHYNNTSNHYNTSNTAANNVSACNSSNNSNSNLPLQSTALPLTDMNSSSELLYQLQHSHLHPEGISAITDRSSSFMAIPHPTHREHKTAQHVQLGADQISVIPNMSSSFMDIPHHHLLQHGHLHHSQSFSFFNHHDSFGDQPRKTDSCLENSSRQPGGHTRTPVNKARVVAGQGRDGAVTRQGQGVSGMTNTNTKTNTNSKYSLNANATEFVPRTSTSSGLPQSGAGRPGTIANSSQGERTVVGCTGKQPVYPQTNPYYNNNRLQVPYGLHGQQGMHRQPSVHGQPQTFPAQPKAPRTVGGSFPHPPPFYPPPCPPPNKLSRGQRFVTDDVNDSFVMDDAKDFVISDDVKGTVVASLSNGVLPSCFQGKTRQGDGSRHVTFADQSSAPAKSERQKEGGGRRESGMKNFGGSVRMAYTHQMKSVGQTQAAPSHSHASGGSQSRRRIGSGRFDDKLISLRRPGSASGPPAAASKDSIRQQSARQEPRLPQELRQRLAAQTAQLGGKFVAGGSDRMTSAPTTRAYPPVPTPSASYDHKAAAFYRSHPPPSMADPSYPSDPSDPSDPRTQWAGYRPSQGPPYPHMPHTASTHSNGYPQGDYPYHNEYAKGEAPRDGFSALPPSHGPFRARTSAPVAGRQFPPRFGNDRRPSAEFGAKADNSSCEMSDCGGTEARFQGTHRLRRFTRASLKVTTNGYSDTTVTPTPTNTISSSCSDKSVASTGSNSSQADSTSKPGKAPLRVRRGYIQLGLDPSRPPFNTEYHSRS